MIKIKNLTYNYDKRFSALYELNLNVSKNEKLILLNETGLESQTLFRLISKQDKLQKGEIYLDNKNLKEIKSKDLSVCYITATPFLLNKNVIKNLIYPLKIRKINKKYAKIKANEILNKFNLKNINNKKIKYLSNFEKIKISILRAMMRDYNILLIDDIFYFNEKENNELFNLINYLIIDKTVLINIKNKKLINNLNNFKIINLNNGIINK